MDIHRNRKKSQISSWSLGRHLSPRGPVATQPAPATAATGAGARAGFWRAGSNQTSMRAFANGPRVDAWAPKRAQANENETKILVYVLTCVAFAWVYR